MKTKALINFLMILIVLTGLLSVSQPAQATPKACTPGPHGGTLAADETWCASDNPHRMSIVIVPAGITLTLEPGTVIQADPQTDLRILAGGHLEAVGTPDQMITLTSLADSGPDQWNGLNFRGGTGNLDYVTVRYGGSLSVYSGMAGNVSLFDVQDGVVSIQHSQILDVGNIEGYPVHGLNVTNSRLELTDTLFSGNALQSGANENEGYPMSITGVNSVVTMSGNVFTDNLNDRVLIDQVAMTANAQVTLYRQNTLEGYEFNGGYLIPAEMTLTVEPGVTLMGCYGQGIQVGGQLL